MENPEDPAGSESLIHAHAETYEFDAKHGRLIMDGVKMTERRAKHCLLMMPDPSNSYNKLIIVIGGVTVKDRKNPYTKKTVQSYHDLDSVEYFSLAERKW